MSQQHTPEPSLKDRADAIGLYNGRLIDWVIRVEELTKQRDELLAALEAILPWIPTTSASEGGAARFSANVQAADKVRAAIAKVKGGA